MKLFKDRFLIISIFAGLLIRLFLSPIQGFKFDIDTWFAWAIRLNTVGFGNFYSDQIWTSYPPGFLYILGFLGFLKNLFSINDSLFYMILKLPSVLAELGLGIFIYKITSNSWKKLGLIFILFNPAFIFNSAVFGQFDGLFTLVILLSIFYLNQKKIILSSLFWGLSFLLKPQAILLFPLYFVYLTKNFSIKNIFQIAIPASLLTVLLFLPFISSNFTKLINIVSTLFGYYPYNSIFAYNLWGILGFWVPDSTTWANISYQNWGYILYSIFCLMIVLVYWKKKNLSLYDASALSALGFFFLLTRMHERYLYPALCLLIIVAVLKKSRLLLVLSGIFTFIYLLDLYYVYIYYNVFYLKISSVLLNLDVYNFADKNLKLISFFSTFSFIFASIGILKINNETNKA